MKIDDRQTPVKSLMEETMKDIPNKIQYLENHSDGSKQI